MLQYKNDCPLYIFVATIETIGTRKLTVQQKIEKKKNIKMAIKSRILKFLKRVKTATVYAAEALVFYSTYCIRSEYERNAFLAKSKFIYEIIMRIKYTKNGPIYIAIQIALFLIMGQKYSTDNTESRLTILAHKIKHENFK